MSVPLDIPRLTHLFSATGPPPAVMEAMLRDPERLERGVRQFCQSMGKTAYSRSGPDTPERLARMAMQFKENSRKDRLLPPTKPPPLQREMMIAELEYQRKDVDKCSSENGYISTTFIGLPIEFSSTPVTNLKPILLSEMLIRKTHKGRYLICRVIAKATRLVAIMIGIEDPDGNPARLSIYNFPTLFDATLDDTEALFPIGTILLIREPTYKMSVSGNSAFIRVDSPSDIVFLSKDDPLLVGIAWRCSINNAPKLVTSAEGWRSRGGLEFKAQRWLAAAVCYTNGLKINPGSTVLLLNRAETYLRLGWYFSALHDAQEALQLGPISDPTLNCKALIRTIKANYGLTRYEEVVRIAEENLQNSECKTWLDKARKRITEQTRGEYDWYELFTCDTRQDVAEFRGPVEVRERDGQPGVRGVFVTRDVAVGELLVVARPLASALLNDTKRNAESFLAFNFITSEKSSLSQHLTIIHLIHQLWDNVRLNAILHSLYVGQSFDRVQYPPNIEKQHPLQHPLKPIKDIDISRIETVVSLNAFSLVSPFKVKKLLGSHGRGLETISEANVDTALYEVPSFLNHSCAANATYEFAGDIMVLRAVRSLKAGDEVTVLYTPPDMPYMQRLQIWTRKWGFTCGCILCQAERIDGATRRQERTNLQEQVINMGPESNFTLLYDKAMGIICQMENAYEDSSERRKCQVKPELFSISCLLVNKLRRSLDELSESRLEKMISLKMRALEYGGIVVRDRSILVQSTDTSMPLDTTRSYCFGHHIDECIMLCLHIQDELQVLGYMARAQAWLDAAKWVFSISVADDSRLFDIWCSDKLSQK